MATSTRTGQSSSQRGVAMFLALIVAIVLSPLYVDRRSDYMRRRETRLSSGFVLPVVLAGLIIAIRTTSSLQTRGDGASATFPTPEPSRVLRIGGSSWGLAGVLVMLMLGLSWQDSAQHFFWK